jgi:hypothetical protein
LLEGLEDALELGGRDPAAGILDLEDDDRRPTTEYDRPVAGSWPP